jgi:hypothetical protein
VKLVAGGSNGMNSFGSIWQLGRDGGSLWLGGIFHFRD